MLAVRHRLGIRWFLLAGVAAWTGALGCGGSSDGPKLVPVVGKVTVGGKLLKTGSVSYRPDKSKGNTSTLEPAGDIEADGTYKLYTAGEQGAPVGWYKVLVISFEPVATPPPTKFYVHAKYGDVATSGLHYQVVEQPAADAYDIKVTPP
jgi:hypothetical protein